MRLKCSYAFGSPNSGWGRGELVLSPAATRYIPFVPLNGATAGKNTRMNAGYANALDKAGLLII